MSQMAVQGIGLSQAAAAQIALDSPVFPGRADFGVNLRAECEALQATNRLGDLLGQGAWKALQQLQAREKQGFPALRIDVVALSMQTHVQAHASLLVGEDRKAAPPGRATPAALSERRSIKQ